MSINYQKLTNLITAKAKAQVQLDQKIRKLLLENRADISDADNRFITNGHLMHIIEFFVLLEAKDLYTPDKMVGYAIATNEYIEQQIEKLHSSSISKAEFEYYKKDLLRSHFPPRAINLMHTQLLVTGAINKKPIERFLARHMCIPFVSRGLKIMQNSRLLICKESPLGGKSWKHTDKLIKLYNNYHKSFMGHINA